VRRCVALLVLSCSLATADAATAATKRGPDTIAFRPVLTTIAPAAETSTTLAPADRAAAAVAVASCDDAAVAELAVVPTTRRAGARGDDCVVFPERPGGSGVPRYYLGPVGVTGRAVKHARVEYLPGEGWVVRLQLTPAGSRAWDALAEEQLHEQVAITLDGVVLVAPTVQPDSAGFESFGGVAVISAGFSEKEARAVVQRIRAANRR
jgi:preprotein translocase subunit SecD